MLNDAETESGCDPANGEMLGKGGESAEKEVKGILEQDREVGNRA